MAPARPSGMLEVGMLISRTFVQLMTVIGVATSVVPALVSASPASRGQQATTPAVEWGVWPEFPLGAKDRQHVLDLAREAGVTPAQVSTTMDVVPMGCPVLVVESARVRNGQQRTWTSVLIAGRTPKLWRRDCEPKRRDAANPHHPWSVRRGPVARSDWVFEDGAWQHAVVLQDVSYEEARPLVLAFHRNEVNVDRAAGRQVPVGDAASLITSISRGHTSRWAVHIEDTYSGTIYEVDLRDGRYVIVEIITIIA